MILDFELFIILIHIIFIYLYMTSNDDNDKNNKSYSDLISESIDDDCVYGILFDH